MASVQLVKDFVEGNYGVGRVRKVERIGIGIANENFVVETQSAKYVFRVYLHSFVQRTEKSVGLELGFMDFLGSRGMKVPRAVRQESGLLFSVFGGSFACLFEFAEGKAELEPSAEHCFLVGEECARIRKYSRGFVSDARPPDTGVELAFGLAEELLHEKLGKCEREMIEEEKDYLQGLPREVEKGFVHGDIFPDNVLFKDNGLAALLDFELCYYGEFLMDLTNILCSWCFTNDCFDFEKAIKTIQGYSRVISLPEEERGLLYDYTRLSSLFL
jgi:homoserine kinase type II